MQRCQFLGQPVSVGIALGGPAALEQAPAVRGRRSDLPSRFTPSAYTVPKPENSALLTPDYFTYAEDLVIERSRPGKPHKGKVLAAIQAHSDDITLFCAGTVAKLIDEGYTGYLIRLSNDEKAGKTVGQGVVQNETDNEEAAKALGCKAFSFYLRRPSCSVEACSDTQCHLFQSCIDIRVRIASGKPTSPFPIRYAPSGDRLLDVSRPADGAG